MNQGENDAQKTQSGNNRQGKPAGSRRASRREIERENKKATFGRGQKDVSQKSLHLHALNQ